MMCRSIVLMDIKLYDSVILTSVHMLETVYSNSADYWLYNLLNLSKYTNQQFLPRDATQSAVLLWQVVCLSVCP